MSMRLSLGLAAAAISLSGCAYDMYGDPYGYGYGPYGSVSAGYYGSYGYGSYGYGGYDPFGWYGDYYYPGAGIYVYDSNRHRHVWNGSQRQYWNTRTSNWHNRTGSAVTHENWSGFSR